MLNDMQLSPVNLKLIVTHFIPNLPNFEFTPNRIDIFYTQ